MHALTEFFTGVQFYLFILVVFSAFFWFLPKKYQWVSFLITIILFAYMSYMIVPDFSDDLQLYYWFIDDMRERGRSEFDYFVRQNDFDWKIYKASAYYYYFISKLPNNHYLPLFITLISYGVNFSVINDVSKRFEVNKIYTYLGTMYFLGTYWFFDLVSGIRNGFAFAIAFAASYYFIVAKKHILLCIIGFLIATFFHSAGFVPVAIAVFVILTLNVSGKYTNIILFFGVILGAALLSYLSTKTNNGFVETAFMKSEHYEAGSSIKGFDIFNLGTMYYVNIAAYLVVFLLSIYTGYYMKKCGSERPELLALDKLNSSVLYFALGSLTFGLLFVRFVRWIVPVIGCIYFMLCMQLQKNEIEGNYEAYRRGFVPPNERIRYKLRPYVIILFVAFTAVHIWYACNGSSLIWAHFEHEWLENGMEEYVW